MSEENDSTKFLQQNEISNESTTPQIPDIFNSEFFKSFEPPKKLPEKKSKISNLIKLLKENPTYLPSLKDEKKILPLYDIILTNLIENNNNFVIAQIDLIELLSEQISNSESNENKNNYVNFYKKALPKLFDKFYLQNQKINDYLLKVFDNSIKRNILQLKDYYPLIENICIEEDDEYKTNILNFLYEQINKDDNISVENIPLNIIETVKKTENNEDNENLNEISKRIMETLNNRNTKPENNENNENNDLLNIPTTPLSQQDSKLAFSSFIKKISKAVKQENLNKKLNNMKSAELDTNNIMTNNNTNTNITSNNINENENEDDTLINVISKNNSNEKIEDLPEENEQNNNIEEVQTDGNRI